MPRPIGLDAGLILAVRQGCLGGVAGQQIFIEKYENLRLKPFKRVRPIDSHCNGIAHGWEDIEVAFLRCFDMINSFSSKDSSMAGFKIAAAQIPAIKGDIKANLITHLKAVEKAAKHGVSYIIFPELSLTGYELELAQSLAITAEDERLKPLMQSAQDNDIHINIGVPLKGVALPSIASLIFCPDGSVSIYEKINLHPGEEVYFTSGVNYHLTAVGKHQIASAICADIKHPNHVAEYVQRGATIYAAGALITQAGYALDTDFLRGYAKENNILVLLVNYNEETGGLLPAGKSAVWYGSKQLAAANETQSALVIAEETAAGWHGEVVNI